MEKVGADLNGREPTIPKMRVKSGATFNGGEPEENEVP